MVIDSAPLTEVVDALPLARHADDVVVVVRLGQTRLDRVLQLAELLAENGDQAGRLRDRRRPPRRGAGLPLLRRSLGPRDGRPGPAPAAQAVRRPLKAGGLAARIDPARWYWALGVAALSCLVGLLAGRDPTLAIAVSIGLGFLLLTVADLLIGVTIFTVASFLELATVASGVGIAKVLGLALAISWVATIVAGKGRGRFVWLSSPGLSADGRRPARLGDAQPALGRVDLGGDRADVPLRAGGAAGPDRLHRGSRRLRR